MIIWASWDYIDYWHDAYFRCIEDPFYDVHVLCVYLCILMHTYAYIYIYIDTTYVCMCMYLYSYAIYIHICL